MTKNDKWQIATAVIAVIIVIVAWCMTDTPTPAYAPDSIELATTNTTATTTTTSTTTTTATTSTTTTTNVTTVTTTTTETTVTTTYDFKDRLVYIGEFYGSYYHGKVNPCPGGSGRMLEDCTPKDSEMKGSVACRAIQETYDYYVNGRTRVYLELQQYPEMNGWYWVDDACLYYDNVDFYFINYSDCPWYNDGITEHINLWVEPS